MNKYYISSFHDTYEDSYQNGEGAFCNSWKQERIIKANNLNEALKEYFHNELFTEYNIENLDIDENTIYTSILVNSDNYQASLSDIENWKIDDIILYSQNITIKAEIMQEVNIEKELLTIQLKAL